MKNPLSPAQFGRLKESIAWSEKQLAFPRRKRVEAAKELAGFHYAENGSQLRVPVPMLPLAVQIYVRTLASRTPRALVTTRHAELKPTASSMELAINQIPDEIGLVGTLRKLVEEALFSMGIVKVGLHKVGTALGHEYGESFVDLITMDDYFWDMSAKNRESISYEGNQYWLDYEECKEASWLDESARDELRPDEYSTIGLAGEDRADGIASRNTADQYRDRVWLRDIWLPKDKLLLTIGAKSGNYMRAVEWTGPANGPYPKLGFTDVPGNLLPLPPVALWRDLHELSNRLFRKLGEQADAQKTCPGFNGSDDEGVQNFKTARDGEGVKYNGSTPVKLEAGGVDPKTLAFYLQCKGLFSYFTGNLDSLGGLAIQAPTLGQDKLLSDASSSQMRDMADRTIETVREIFKQLAFYEWNDPVKKRLLEKPIPGTDLVLPVSWDKDAKKGSFDSYDLDIDVYSLQDNSPSVRMQKLNLFVERFIIPLQPNIEAASGTVDVQRIFELAAKYSDFPELGELVHFIDAPGGPGMSPQQAMSPANTSHTTTRVGQPGMSSQGADAALSQQLLSDGGMESTE